MELKRKNIEVIQAIQGKLAYGDIKAISGKLNLNRSYVSKCLNTINDFYNEGVIDEAIAIIQAREAKKNKQLKSIVK